ncbi:MAG TPA: phage portal protein, partial [Brevibacterium sp.]|nr:phage portal protein [Brevibacterium sp.]
MTALDRMIGWVSPTWAAKRALARLRAEAARAYYDGATVGRRGASIRRSAADANVITRSTLPRLRNGARDLVRNNPHARRAVEAIVANTVGTGIEPQFMRHGERADELERLEALHLDTTTCDAEGRHTYHGLVSLAFHTLVESGEVLIRRRWRRASDGLAVPVQFQVLEPDYLDQSKDSPTASGGQIVQGVEYDAIGRVRAYWLFSEHPGGDGYHLQSRPVPARDVIHALRVDRPGQVRGIPWLSPVMLRLADFADYEDAQLVRQKIAACFSAFVREPVDGFLPHGVQRDADGDLIDRFEPGIIERLPPGAEIEFAEPPGVDGYGEYAAVSLRAIAAGMGISYAALTGDLTSVNFSSGRMGH